MRRQAVAMGLSLGLMICGSVLGAKKKWEGPPEGTVEVSSFVVIVNSANPIDQLSSNVLSDYFFKKKDRWPDGTKVLPVDQKVESRVRSMFTLAVHFKRPAAVQSYWQQKLFAGEDVPPPELASDVEVLTFVSQNPGAVGYLSGDWKLSAEVKVLQIVQ